MKKIIAACLLLMMAALSPASAQTISPSIFNVAGGSYNANNSYYKFEWSFGESMVVQLLSAPDSTMLVTHGVLQPCTDKPGTSPGISFFGTDEYRIFPNPTTDKFEINFFVRQVGQMTLKLMDATGRELELRSYDYNGCCRIEQFDLSKYPNGMYYVSASLEPADRSATRQGGFKIMKLKN